MGNKSTSAVPAYNEMMHELFQAMHELGGSGTIAEIDDQTIDVYKRQLCGLRDSASEQPVFRNFDCNLYHGNEEEQGGQQNSVYQCHERMRKSHK